MWWVFASSASRLKTLDSVTLTIRKLEQEILAAGHHVCILTTLSGDPKNTHLDGEHPNRRLVFMDNAISIPFLQDPNNPNITYQIGFSLSNNVKQQIADFEPSVVHITCPDCTALHLIQYAREKEFPLMGTYHSNIPEYMDHYPGLSWLKHILAAFFRHQYNFLQALYVPTPFIRHHLVDTYHLDKATNLHIWGRGVDVDKFHPSYRSLKYRRDLGIQDHEVVVCWVGRLVPEKRVDIFCDTVKRLHDQHVPFKALVVGAGPCEAEIQRLPNTIFAGWMTVDQLSEAYASSDVFLFPSSVETFGNVTLEAMASGLPVVVEQGCSGHLVHNNENGFAIEAGDADAFYHATYKIVTDHALRRSFGEESRRLSVGMEKRAVVRKMLDNYSRVTDEFYIEYGGRHHNRDAAYRQPHSFQAGNHPRPLLLVFVERLFIVLFQVIWNMVEVFVYMQSSIGGMQRSTSETTNLVQASPARKRASSELGMSDVELGATSSDEDSLTAASTESEEYSTTTSSPAYSFVCGRQDQAFGDCELSHVLSRSFIRSMEFQCRMESHFRNTCNSCCSRALSMGAKRKNSSDGLIEEAVDDAAGGHSRRSGRRFVNHNRAVEV